MIEDNKTKRPNICVVSHPIGETGDSAPRTLLDILSAITTVALVTTDVPTDAPIRENYDIIDIGEKAIGGSVFEEAVAFVISQIRISRVISSRDEEVILFFGTTTYLIPIIWAQLIGRTVILEPRGDVPLRLRIYWEQRLPSFVARGLAGALSLLERVGYRTADAIITYTPSMAEELGLDRYESKLFSNGARYVDTEAFTVQTPFEKRDPIVGYLGRFEEGKGVKALADAVPLLPEDITVRFIGDGPLADEIKADLEDEIAAGQVELAGWVEHEEVPSELNRLQLFVLPSESEGLPTTVLEALACGTPVYATPVSGVPDVVKDGETGFHISEISPEALASEIERIIYEEPLVTISQNGRELIENEFTLKAAVERYTEILINISSRSEINR